MTTVNNKPNTVQRGFAKSAQDLAEKVKAQKAPSSTSAQGASGAASKPAAKPSESNATAAELSRDRFEPAGGAKSQTAQGALLVQSSPSPGAGGSVQGLVGEQLRAALDAARLAGGAGAKNVKTPEVKPK